MEDGPENPELSDDWALICSPLPRDWPQSVLLTNFSLPAGFGGLASKARTWSPLVPSVTSSPVQRRSNELNAFTARLPRAAREIGQPPGSPAFDKRQIQNTCL